LSVLSRTAKARSTSLRREQRFSKIEQVTWFGFKPQVLLCEIATEAGGPWEEVSLTSGDTPGLLNLEGVGPSFPIRFLKVTIIRGYRDGEELLGTSIRDLAVYLFRNWARNKTATADSVWDYNPAMLVDGDRTTRWVSRYDTQHAKLENISPAPDVPASEAWPPGTLVHYESSSVKQWLPAVIQSFNENLSSGEGTYNLDVRECAAVDRMRPRSH